MKFNYFILFFVCLFLKAFAQSDSVKTFDPKEEIAFDGKRYRVHNNWVSVGFGAGFNQRWKNDGNDQRNIGVDYSFHLKEQYLRIGAFMSGNNYLEANNYNFHLQYAIRKEGTNYNLSGFIGPSYSSFKRPLSDSSEFGLENILARTYSAFGGHACIEAVYKFKYDLGIGGQVFCDYNPVQLVYGVRLIAYFSSSYRGIKYGRTKPKK